MKTFTLRYGRLGLFQIVAAIFVAIPAYTQTLNLPDTVRMGRFDYFSESLPFLGVPDEFYYSAVHTYALQVGNNSKDRVEILDIHAVSSACLKLRTVDWAWHSTPRSIAGGETATITLRFNTECDEQRLSKDVLRIKYFVHGNSNVSTVDVPFVIEFLPKKPMFLVLPKVYDAVACLPQTGDTLLKFNFRTYAGPSTHRFVVFDSVDFGDMAHTAALTSYIGCNGDLVNDAVFPIKTVPRNCTRFAMHVRVNGTKRLEVPMTLYWHYQGVNRGYETTDTLILDYKEPERVKTENDVEYLRARIGQTDSSAAINLCACPAYPNTFLDSITISSSLENNTYNFVLQDSETFPMLIETDYGMSRDCKSKIRVHAGARVLGRSEGIFTLHFRGTDGERFQRWIYSSFSVTGPSSVGSS